MNLFSTETPSTQSPAAAVSSDASFALIELQGNPLHIAVLLCHCLQVVSLEGCCCYGMTQH